MSIAKKKKLIKDQVIQKHGCQGIHCSKCINIHRFIDKMADSNIPVGYWKLGMNKFTGSDKLKEIATEYMSNLKNHYMKSTSICLSGAQGTGKTMSSICILKAAIRKGFSVYYITASDLQSEIFNYEINSIIKQVDFLAVDEVDSRFFVSEAQKLNFSGHFENILRYRTHNEMPTIICTNETESILNVFAGQCVRSIKSLFSQYVTVYPVSGKDFRQGRKQ